MMVESQDGKKDLEMALSQQQDGVFISIESKVAHESEGDNIVLDEHGLNLLIESLRSAAEDIRRHREQNEADRLNQEGRLHGH